ncbi:hypothetical protein [Streptomyces sp. Go40/10]|uniref:hypothetical protein n=1 Tax=Streptomyces sp. Go40/10 TaxID=2825844 RepID=UPI003FA6F561
MGEVAGAADVQERGGFPGGRGAGDDQAGACGVAGAAAEDRHNAHLVASRLMAGVRMVTKLEW